jgi:hypothetical protein
MSENTNTNTDTNTDTDTPIYEALAAKLGIDPLGILDAPVRKPPLWERVVAWLR